jgi:hypothetical protein
MSVCVHGMPTRTNWTDVVAALVVGPAMEEETGLLVLQEPAHGRSVSLHGERARRAERVTLLDVDEDLLLCLLHILRPVQEEADLGEREDRHHQGVVPELAIVVRDVGRVAEASRLGPASE